VLSKQIADSAVVGKFHLEMFLSLN